MKHQQTIRVRAVAVAQNQWVTILLNVFALLIMVGNFLLTSPVFPKEWTIWVALVLGILNVLVEWLSKLPIDG
jgi:hypothetical protein